MLGPTSIPLVLPCTNHTYYPSPDTSLFRIGNNGHPISLPPGTTESTLPESRTPLRPGHPVDPHDRVPCSTSSVPLTPSVTMKTTGSVVYPPTVSEATPTTTWTRQKNYVSDEKIYE